jgi:hypothetical protein
MRPPLDGSRFPNNDKLKRENTMPPTPCLTRLQWCDNIDLSGVLAALFWKKAALLLEKSSPSSFWKKAVLPGRTEPRIQNDI